MKYELEPYHNNIPEEDLLDDLKSVAKKIGKERITKSEYNSLGKYHSQTLYHRFGSWNEALQRAGLKISHYMSISNEECFENLEKVWEKLGKQPSYHDMHGPLSKYSGKPYVRLFGSWRKALETFVKYINEGEEDQKEPLNIAIEKDLSIKKMMHKHRTKREVNWRMRFKVMQRDNFKCKFCGRSPAKNSEIELHVDHIKPYSKGGESILDNLQTLCSRCNIGKSNL